MKVVIDHLPEGWVWARVGEICNPVNGRAFKPSEWLENGLPIIRIQNLKDPNARFNFYKGEIDSKFRVDKGDLLFAWSGTPGTSFGAHIWFGAAGVLNQHIFNVRFNRRLLNPQYLRDVLNHKVSEFVRQAQGWRRVSPHHQTKIQSLDYPPPTPPRTTPHRGRDRKALPTPRRLRSRPEAGPGLT